MRKWWLTTVGAMLLVSGCRTPPLESIDQSVADMVVHPFDVAPAPHQKPVLAGPTASGAAPDTASKPANTQPLPGVATPGPSAATQGVSGHAPASENVIQASLTQVKQARSPQQPSRSDASVIRASLTHDDRSTPGVVALPPSKFELTIPKAVPGSETPLVTLPAERSERPGAVARLFPPLPPLPEEPVAMSGPDGRPYTLADFQRLAAANNPALRQAASDVEAAKGVMIQVGLYPNPTIGYETAPNANNTGSTTLGFFVDQVIKTGGKLTIARAAARMNMVVAELALKRARYDLATMIRGDFYTLLVAKETVRVNKGLAHFTDEIFRLQADLLAGGFAASHEPTALRSQSFVVRLGYKQAIANYIYAWKELVADIGLRQLPLSAVEGQVDRLIPYYDYDTVLAHVLHNHTDVLTARANLDGARYTLKLNQVAPTPDVDVRGDIFKEHQVFPLQNYYQLSVGIPFPLWDRNQGGIRAASAALVRAAEGPHAAEVNLTTNLATAYATYKNNLYAMDSYRRNILPDQVRYYRGVFERRRIDPSVAFGDLVQAQQVLVTDVTAYLGILGSLWTSVVGVADYLQTDDLYQLGKPYELPEIPNLDMLHEWACPHPHPAPGTVDALPVGSPVPHAGAPDSVAPPAVPAPAPTADKPANSSAPGGMKHVSNAGEKTRDRDLNLPIVEAPLIATISRRSAREQFERLMGQVESLPGIPTSMTIPPDSRPSGPFTPVAARPESAASVWGGA